MKQAVIVDVDGTLLRSASEDDRLYRQAVRRVIGEVRLRPDLHAYQRVTDTGILLQILEDNELMLTESLIADVKAEFVAAVAGHIDRYGPFQPVPGAQKFVSRLKSSEESGIAIATGGWRPSAELKLRTSGFDIAGVPLASSDDAIDRTEIMRIALDSLPGSFDVVTYYGDGLWDRVASETLGWRFRAVGPDLEGIDSFDSEVAG